MADMTFDDLIGFDYEADESSEAGEDEAMDATDGENQEPESEDVVAADAKPDTDEPDEPDESSAKYDKLQADYDALVARLDKEDEDKKAADKKAAETDDDLDEFLKSLDDDEDDDAPVTRAEFREMKKALKSQQEWTSKRDEDNAQDAMNAEVAAIRSEYPEISEKFVLMSFVKGVDPREAAKELREGFIKAGYKKSVDSEDDKGDEEAAPAPLSAPPKTTPSSARKTKKKETPKDIESWDDLLDI